MWAVWSLGVEGKEMVCLDNSLCLLKEFTYASYIRWIGGNYLEERILLCHSKSRVRSPGDRCTWVQNTSGLELQASSYWISLDPSGLWRSPQVQIWLSQFHRWFSSTGSWGSFWVIIYIMIKHSSQDCSASDWESESRFTVIFFISVTEGHV